MYYPKQGAIINGTMAPMVRYCRKSKAQGALFLKNVILRRKSPSYSVKLRSGFYCGRFKLMIRDKWDMTRAENIYSPRLTNEIVVEVQAQQSVLDTLHETLAVPVNNIVVSSFPNGKLVISKAFWRLLNWNTKNWIKAYLQAYYNVTETDSEQVFISKEFGQTALSVPRRPVTDAAVPFNQHMNQWAV
jgi:hypothetical protein